MSRLAGISSPLRQGNLTLVNGTLAHPSLRWAKEPKSGWARLSSGATATVVNSFRSMETTEFDTIIRSNTAGAGHVAPLAFARANLTTADGQETAIDGYEGAARVGRIALYRQSSTKYGWRIYGSTSATLTATPDLSITADGVVIARSGLSCATLSASGGIVGGSLTVLGSIGGSALGVSGAVSGSSGTFSNAGSFGGDITVTRASGSSPTTGAIFFGNSGLRYILWTGSVFSVNGSLSSTGVLSGTSLSVSGVIGGASLSVTGTIGGGAITGASLNVTGDVSGTSINITGNGAISGYLTVGPGVSAPFSVLTSGAISGTSLNVGSGAITGGAITGTSLNVGSGAITGGALTGTNGTFSGLVLSNSLGVGAGVVAPFSVASTGNTVTSQLTVNGEITINTPGGAALKMVGVALFPGGGAFAPSGYYYITVNGLGKKVPYFD